LSQVVQAFMPFLWLLLVQLGGNNYSSVRKLTLQSLFPSAICLLPS
jgi:hypothetical protein